MTRLTLLLSAGFALAATAAQACASCDEEIYNPMTAYIDYRGMTPDEQRAADAAAAEAAQQAAMDKARLAFMSRFHIRSDEQPAAVAEEDQAARSQTVASAQ